MHILFLQPINNNQYLHIGVIYGAVGVVHFAINSPMTNKLYPKFKHHDLGFGGLNLPIGLHPGRARRGGLVLQIISRGGFSTAPRIEQLLLSRMQYLPCKRRCWTRNRFSIFRFLPTSPLGSPINNSTKCWKILGGVSVKIITRHPNCHSRLLSPPKTAHFLRTFDLSPA